MRTISLFGWLALAALGVRGAADDTQSNRAAATHPLFDLTSAARSPFPSDRFTVADPDQITGRRVNLPYPADCTVLVSECEDITELNQLDGFSMTPRISIPFDGNIDPSTVTSRTVFIVLLGEAAADGGTILASTFIGSVIGINRVVWDPGTHTVHVSTDRPLDEHSRYALVVTNGVLGADGLPIKASPEFKAFRPAVVRSDDAQALWYSRALLAAEAAANQTGTKRRNIAALSLFTTRSATYLLAKIRDQIFGAEAPAPDFRIGPGGSRAVYAFNRIASITFNQQVTTTPTFSPSTGPNLVPLRFVPSVVDRVALGRYDAPDYLIHPGQYIPKIKTRAGVPAVQGRETLYFNLILPSGQMPPNGWPVAIVGHGRGQNKNFQVDSGTSIVAAEGIAQVQINAVGHGFGPLGTLDIAFTDGTSVNVPAGGRGFDQNGDGQISNFEGSEALAPHALRTNTDAMVQTIAEYMALVRMIQRGVDVDGDGRPDLDGSRIKYYGHSQGAMLGLPFHAMTPAVQASVFLAIASPLLENRRLSPASRPLVGAKLAARTPSLLNTAYGLTSIGGVPVAAGPVFNENMPFRDQAPIVNDIPGAIDIQIFLDRAAWIGEEGDPLPFAPLLRRSPPEGVPARPFLLQNARGDQSNPLPALKDILLAGDIADRVALYRHDLFWPTQPTVFKNSHPFPIALVQVPWRPIVVGAQQQFAAFLASGGVVAPQPTPGQYWEFPLFSGLPDELDFIP
jgi:hypothetical protein